MQTFVPLTNSFSDIAKVLDRQRLNKQALEGWQILMTLLELDPQGEHRIPKGWVNHPATVMWRGCEQALIHYGMVICAEWQERGFKDTLYDKFYAEWHNDHNYKEPWWLGYDPLHTSHQSNLYRKDPVYYKDFAITAPNLPNVWCHPDGTIHLGTEKEILDSRELL
jgi:hypothetical protein